MLPVKNILLCYFFFVIFINSTNGLLRRCYQCRSRGELGSCRDPFRYNSTEFESKLIVSTIPCASGWCGKVTEGGGAYSSDDYDMAIQRMCVQRGPDDNEDRCAYTLYNNRKVFMCFCQGDLCNSSNQLFSRFSIFLTFITLFVCYKFKPF